MPCGQRGQSRRRSHRSGVASTLSHRPSSRPSPARGGPKRTCAARRPSERKAREPQADHGAPNRCDGRWRRHAAGSPAHERPVATTLQCLHQSPLPGRELAGPPSRPSSPVTLKLKPTHLARFFEGPTIAVVDSRIATDPVSGNDKALRAVIGSRLIRVSGQSPRIAGDSRQPIPSVQATGAIVIGQLSAPGGNSPHRVRTLHMISPTVGTLQGPSLGTGCPSVSGDDGVEYCESAARVPRTARCWGWLRGSTPAAPVLGRAGPWLVGRWARG